MREADDGDKLHKTCCEYTENSYKAGMWLILTKYKKWEEVSSRVKTLPYRYDKSKARSIMEQ